MSFIFEERMFQSEYWNREGAFGGIYSFCYHFSLFMKTEGLFKNWTVVVVFYCSYRDMKLQLQKYYFLDSGEFGTLLNMNAIITTVWYHT